MPSSPWIRQDRADPYVEAMAKMLAAIMPLAPSDLLSRREHPPPRPHPPPALRTSLHGSSDVQGRCAVGDQHINGGGDGNYVENGGEPVSTIVHGIRAKLLSAGIIYDGIGAAVAPQYVAFASCGASCTGRIRRVLSGNRHSSIEAVSGSTILAG